MTENDNATLGTWDKGYELRVLVLMALGFGLVGLDRWIIAPLFPAIMVDLKLDYAGLGTLIGVLALTWGGSAILAGNLSDRFGRRRILIPAILAFSFLSAFTGLAGSAATMIMIRGAMGVAEGAFCPTSVAVTAEASRPRRRGLNLGFLMSGFALLGFGLAPILATQLLAVLPSWREVFLIVGLPGLLIAYGAFRVVREPAHLHALAPVVESPAWRDALATRNIRLATIALFCAMSCIFVMGGMVPNYLVDYLHIAPTQMGFIMSALGWGGFVGELILPGLSDIVGRRLASILGFSGALVGVIWFTSIPASPVMLFCSLAFVAFFGLGLLSLLTGPIAIEAVPPGLISSAIGLVSGAGEIFGGGIAPIIAGFVAQRAGIDKVFFVPITGLAIGIVVSIFFKETAPHRRRRWRTDAPAKA